MRPVVKVREMLEEQRRGGREFAHAWLRAIRSLDAEERREWQPVLYATAPAWRSAYERTPATRAQLALLVVDQDPERDVPTGQADPWERICAHCDGPIAADKRRDARFCCASCQRQFHGRRVAA